ncbi:hypothetical protein FQZ97_1130670 [compost metagenome]
MRRGAGAFGSVRQAALRFMLRASKGSLRMSQGTKSRCSFQLPAQALMRRNSAASMAPLRSAARPYCTPTLSQGMGA